MFTFIMGLLSALVARALAFISEHRWLIRSFMWRVNVVRRARWYFRNKARAKLRAIERADTSAALSAMLKQNTGMSILDSGGYSGRHWQHNARRDFENEQEGALEIRARNGGAEINASVSLFVFLRERVTLDAESKKIQVAFDAFAETSEQENKTWDETIKDFVKSVGGTLRYSFYTYNDGENMLDQDFIAQVWNDADDKAYAFIQSHNGCDARGGFSSPRVFALNYETELYDYGRATIACGNGHWWDCEEYRAGFDNDEYPALHTFRVISQEDIDAGDCEIDYDIAKLRAAYREYNALRESPRLPNLADVNPQMPSAGAIFLDSDGAAHCPLCGDILSVYAPCAG